MRYVIVYTNEITIQGNHVYYLASRVNIFLKWKVQRVAPTFAMQASTIGSITKYVMSLVINFINVGNCWKI